VKLPKNPQMFRCRLVRFVDGFPQTVTYVGPFEGWTDDWHMVMRVATSPRGGLAA
jgi:hypothetical protein